jgi:membrane dipeptidase
MNAAVLKPRPQSTHRVVNCVGAPVFDNLKHALLTECIESGVGIVGVTAQESWNETVEAMESLQHVKDVVRTHGRAFIVERKSDLTRPENADKVGVIIGFQNPKPFSDSLGLLHGFLDMGLRCISFAMKDNSYLGSGHAMNFDRDTGLTSFGRDVVRTMNERGAVIDLSHSGDRTALEAVELSAHPAVFSHSTARTWVQKNADYKLAHGVTHSPSKRAAPDELIRAAAAKGGVICPDARTASADEFISQMDHLIELVGWEHVGVAAQDDWHRSEKDTRKARRYQPGYGSHAGGKERVFGSDYRIYRLEGTMGPRLMYPENLRSEMRKRGYPDDAIDGIMGGNLMRVFSTVLPE